MSTLTRESLRAGLNAMARQRGVIPIMLLHPAAKRALEREAQTRTLRRIGPYAYREYKGERFWVRMKSMYGYSFGIFPRDLGEGWTSWIHQNRHWRRRGWPQVMEGFEFRKRMGRCVI